MESIVGQTVSHYAFLERLGAGGMGEIYKARDSRLNRIVAVKVLAPGRTRDPERRRRFIQEAQAASALNHPNIITIHDILPEGDTQYMVMEHVSGRTLQAMIAEGRLAVPQALQISTQMANALAAAHAAGIIHRDLKPANVMVTSSGLVKVLDFGLAKLLDPSSSLRSPAGGGQTEDPVTLTAAPLTVEGSIMGTVNYMSPEQAEGLKVDARSDIFSFGAVLYEMVTGRRAFDGDSGISTLSAVLRDEVKPIAEIAPDVPAELDDLIARCLRKSPGDRWQSMTEVATALNSLRVRLDTGVVLRPVGSTTEPQTAPAEPPVASASTVPPPPASRATAPAAMPPSAARVAPKSGKKKAVLLGAVCAAVVAVALVGAWWQIHQQRQTQQSPPAPTPVATGAPPAPPQPTPAPAAVSPQTAPDAVANSGAPATIPLTAAPPPSTPNVPLTSKLKTLAPPPVLTGQTKLPAQPQVAAIAAAPVAVAPVPRAPESVPVQLNDGLPFRISLLEDVPSDIEVGHALRFRVLDGLQVGDVVVIAKGSIVTGSVAALAGRRNFFGERSKVTFRLISAESVDDNKINVRAIPAAKDGAETRPFETSKSSPKDKNLIAPSGTEYVAYVAGDQTVTVHK
jgi:serine/threonine protein kinase